MAATQQSLPIHTDTQLFPMKQGVTDSAAITSNLITDIKMRISIAECIRRLCLLRWDEVSDEVMQIQENNLRTLIDLWPSLKNVQEIDTKWGDEIEYVLLQFDHAEKKVKVAPKGSQVINGLSKDKSANAVDIQREAYEYMVETSPAKPYTSDLQQLVRVEQDMLARRQAIQGQLDQSTAVFSLSRFGMFGAQKAGTSEGTATPDEILKEADDLITTGSRYKPLLTAIERRRGHRMNVEASLYGDKDTASSSVSIASVSTEADSTSSTESITIDNPIYAMGGCGLQVTFGATDLSQALHLHDQFCPVGPLMLALTAASPIVKGSLIETDARWHHCAMSADDRSPSEAHLNPRWATSPMYFEDVDAVQALNTPLASCHNNEGEFRKELEQAGLSQPLATYFAHNLGRHPFMHPKAVTGTEDDVDLEDRLSQLKTHLSAIWPHIRLKLADPESNLPWMIEFRSMETQPTDFEIAGMSVFLQLLRQAILYFNLELRAPMHMVHENMNRAQVADAVREQKFWFNTSNKLPVSNTTTETTQISELSLDEVFNGQEESETNVKPFPGLIYYVREYLVIQAAETELPQKEFEKIQSYVDLVSRRASGVEPTIARWMREFVLKHPEYNSDCLVTEEIYYDMMCKITERSLA